MGDPGSSPSYGSDDAHNDRCASAVRTSPHGYYYYWIFIVIDDLDVETLSAGARTGYGHARYSGDHPHHEPCPTAGPSLTTNDGDPTRHTTAADPAHRSAPAPGEQQQPGDCQQHRRRQHDKTSGPHHRHSNWQLDVAGNGAEWCCPPRR